MATSRTAKIDAELAKAKEKLAEQQGKIRELERKRTEAENLEIVEIVRGLHIPLDQLTVTLQKIKGGTSGQFGPKSVTNKNDETEESSK